MLYQFLLFLLIGAQVSGLVALGVHTELIVVAGQDGVEDHARQGGDGQAGQGDVCAAHGEGDAAGGAEAQAADEDHRRDDEVPGLGQVHLVFHHVPHAHRGDHTVQDEADAAHDGGGDGVHQGVELGGEGQDDGVQGGQADDPGVIDPVRPLNSGLQCITVIPYRFSF